jgi:hypothetical protein
MSATGEIITEDLRLIERLFYDFRRMLKSVNPLKQTDAFHAQDDRVTAAFLN